ncbi:MAG: FliM/FliN family flagellar motor switch protein [SAR324 cluster bacterium]|nr:FliM/FliN family flagellar motor switch protein [SAR324 cluster bacterium]
MKDCSPDSTEIKTQQKTLEKEDEELLEGVDYDFSDELDDFIEAHEEGDYSEDTQGSSCTPPNPKEETLLENTQPVESSETVEATSYSQEEDIFASLDDNDWSDVEEDLKKNTEQILQKITVSEQPSTSSTDSLVEAPPALMDQTAQGTKPTIDDGGNPLFQLQLPITVEFGRTRLPIHSLLTLHKGATLKLDRKEKEPLNIFVGDQFWAKGELVVVGEKLGVRILERMDSNVGTSSFLA